MNEINLNLINGNEIIDFLNEITNKGSEDLCDISITSGSFVFDDQIVKDDEYVLTFTGSFNNWSTEEEIPNNSLHIDKNSIWFDLNEPFEGDGTDDSLIKVLTNWLKTHTFSENLKANFYEIIHNVLCELKIIEYSEKEKLQNLINKLIKAKTFIK